MLAPQPNMITLTPSEIASPRPPGQMLESPSLLPAFVGTQQQKADGYTKVLDKSTFTVGSPRLSRTRDLQGGVA